MSTVTWRAVLGGVLLAAYAAITAVLCRTEGTLQIVLSAAAGACLGFGLLAAFRSMR